MIQDVRPAYQRGYGKAIKTVTTEALVSELYRRGTTIDQVFGQFYELEQIAAHKDDLVFGNDEEGQHGLTVGDALLAMGKESIEYNQPF